MIVRSTDFKKAFIKFSPKIQNKILEKLSLLVEDEYDDRLNNHALHGEYQGRRSINITGDIRLIYRKEGPVYLLVMVGTHSQLYE